MNSHSSPHSRAERLIATGRVVLAAFSLLAVWLGPSGAASPTPWAYGLLSGYGVYALLVALLVWSWRAHLGRLPLVTHVLDLAAFSFLMYFTGGPSSPFFIYFVFSLVCATVRWQWSGTLWTTLGTLAIDVLDPDDVDPSATAWFDIAKHHEGGQVELAPGDRREVYTHVKMPFMWSSAEQKFLTAYEAHDVAALPEKVVLTVENIWSQGRLTRDTPLNPAAPADPIPALLLETGDEVLLEDGSGHIGLETG